MGSCGIRSWRAASDCPNIAPVPLSALIDLVRPGIKFDIVSAGFGSERSQYVAIRYTERLAASGAVGSVGSKGDSYDNAAAESLNGLYKTEVIRRQGPWKGLDDVELATLEWVDWYNRRRLHSWCGNRPPAEYEQEYYRQTTGAVTEAPAVPSLH